MNTIGGHVSLSHVTAVFKGCQSVKSTFYAGKVQTLDWTTGMVYFGF